MEWFHIWWQGLGLTGQIMACAAIPMTIVMFLQLILMIIGVGFSGDSDSDFDSDSVDIDAGHDIGFDAHFDTGFDAGNDIGFDAHFDTGFDADHDIGFDAHFDAGFDADHDAGFDAHFETDHDAGAGIHAGSGHHDISGGETALRDIAHHHGSLKLLTVRGIVAFFALGGWAGLAALTSGMRALWSVMVALIAGVAAMLVASVVIRFALKMQSSGNLILNNAVSQIAEVYITIPPSRTNTGKVTMVLQERFVELDAVTDSPDALKPQTKVEVIGTAGKDCLLVQKIME